MPTTGEPDLERGDAALKVPADPFSPPSPSLNPTKSPKTPTHLSSNQPVKRKPHPSQPTTHRRQSQHQPLSRPNDPTAIPPKLLKLRTIIGISTPTALLPPTPSSKTPFSNRPAPNLGIYTRIIHEETSAKRQFYFAASIINICYFGQICLAAALTALGASASSNIAITVLGAANTVLAGVLTYLKGQGLPNRLRMYWTGLRKCREFIEEKEREIAAEGYGWVGEKGEGEGDGGVDVDAVVEVIVGMYHDVRQTAEDNTPDTYLPMKGSSATALANKQSPKRTIPYPDEDDISEAAATDDNNDDDNSTKNANGHAIDPKPKPADVAPAKTTGTMSEDDTTDKAAAAAPAANGNVESPAQ